MMQRRLKPSRDCWTVTSPQLLITRSAVQEFLLIPEWLIGFAALSFGLHGPAEASFTKQRTTGHNNTSISSDTRKAELSLEAVA